MMVEREPPNGGMSPWMLRIVPALIPVLFVQFTWSLVWGTRLENRVIVLEAQMVEIVKRVEHIDADGTRKLGVIEERQKSVIEQLRANALKMDSIIEALARHEREQRKYPGKVEQ